MPHPHSAAVAEIAREVRKIYKDSGRRAAMRHAMEASGELLRTPTNAMRFDISKNVFKLFTGYQPSDFECVDYDQYDLVEGLPLFRGPPVPEDALERGDYFCVFGAAQTFGRLARDPWPRLLSEAIDLPVLNISRGAAGPEFFLDPRLIEYARKARFLVVQVMSGRSVGCEDYPGGRFIKRDGQATKVERWDVLKEMWGRDPAIALSYVQKWNRNYLALYAKLQELINRPTMLLWISERDPEGWNPNTLLKYLSRGSFPQLVGQSLYKDVSDVFDEHLEIVTGKFSEKLSSRITGDPCPYVSPGKPLIWDQEYYPTNEQHARIAEALTPWSRGVRDRSPAATLSAGRGLLSSTRAGGGI